MKEHKILDNEKITWHEDERRQLDYQTLFEDNSEPSPSQKAEHPENGEKEKNDVGALLREKKYEWRVRLKNARENAFAKGFEEGKKEGISQSRKEIDNKLTELEVMFEKAHREWKERQEKLNPGLLDLVFEIAESILEIPVENTDIRKKLDQDLEELLQRIDDYSKPMLWISESDYHYVEKLKERYAPETTVNIKISAECNPGEFKFDTDQERVVSDFRKLLTDFKAKLSLPSWK